MDTLYLFALQQIPGIGTIRAKNLIAYCGSAKAVFETPERQLTKIPLIGENVVKEITGGKSLMYAEREFEFCAQQGIEVLNYTDENYPTLLKQMYDAPLIIFKKGILALNAKTNIAIVGTRQATTYGKEVTKQFTLALAATGVNVVSGLAMGIDIVAHKTALSVGASTTCVLGHGLDRMYPNIHKSIALEMLEQGAWVSEYPSQTLPDAPHFPERNRIIAGMCMATLVVEARHSGGALITARIAHAENREVYAVPGDVNKATSMGTNQLIQKQMARLVISPEDLLADLNLCQLLQQETPTFKQTTLATTPEESLILSCLQEKDSVVDELIIKTQISAGKLFSTLLDMEFKGMITQLPGKKFKLA